MMSWPSSSTWPAVGSISRVRHRTRVDLPEPDRPMTTNTSPRATSKLMSRTAVTQPVCSRISGPVSAAIAGIGRDAIGLVAEHLPQVADREVGSAEPVLASHLLVVES